MDALETGKRIQNLRKQHCWTQKALAEQLCVSDKAVSKWERGLNFPDMTILEPLAKVLAGLLYRLEIYDVWLQALSLGMTSFSGLLVGNCLWIWWKHRT